MTGSGKIQSAIWAYDGWDGGDYYTALFGASEDFILWDNAPSLRFWLDEGYGFVCCVLSMALFGAKGRVGEKEEATLLPVP